MFKAYEWPTEVALGHTISSNSFFMFYYMLTGVHLFHVLVGLLILGVVARELRNPRRRRMFMVESGATYWHMVDLLWIAIFALLYVMRRANDHPRRTDDHLAWIILSAITILSWWLAPGHARGAPAVASAPITVAVILLGFIKGHMIIRYFVEVRTAPRWLKLFHRRVPHRSVGRNSGDLLTLGRV